MVSDENSSATNRMSGVALLIFMRWETASGLQIFLLIIIMGYKKDLHKENRKGYKDMNRTIILASASPRRRELLHQVGLRPEIVPSCVEEVITSTEPDQVVMELSAQKAADVAAKYRGQAAVVIGADTVVAADGAILGKPKTEEEAVRMIEMLQGRTHQVYTGVTMIFTDTGEQVTFAEKTEVHVYPMTESEISRYVSTGEPMDKAGAYGIQGYFAAYIEGISGDYNNVVGLPVGRVCLELRRHGN